MTRRTQRRAKGTQPRPDVFGVMTDEERAAPPYEGPELAAWRDRALPGTRWFREHGVSFERHYTGSLACVPSRPTIFTGHYPDLHGVTQTDGLGKTADDTRMRWLPQGEVPTLGNWFRAAGYDTHYDGKWHISHADLFDGDGERIATNTDAGEPIPEGVRAYLDADRPADALAWLQDPWGHLDDSRQDLLADALERLGRFEESSPIRQRMFERTLSDFHFQRWLEHLPEPARAEAVAHARKLALAHDDVTAAATLLLQLGDADAAEARLLAEPGRIDGNDYGRLVPLAKALRADECPRGETVVYRALLKGILDRAYARAYGHAARYWARLKREVAGSCISLLPPPSHDDFEAEARARHGRKSAFWAYVNGTRRDRHDDEDDPTS